MVGGQGVDQFVQALTFHHRIELMQRQVDAVIADPALAEIVGADALRAVTRADLVAARLRTRIIDALTLQIVKPGLQHRQGQPPILMLRLLHRHHHHAGWQMGNAHSRFSFVDVLTARARCPHHVDAQVLRLDVELDILGLWPQKTAEADVAAAKATLTTAQINLGYASVTAPIAGRIGRALVTEGALVGQGEATQLAVVQQISRCT